MRSSLFAGMKSPTLVGWLALVFFSASSGISLAASNAIDFGSGPAQALTQTTQSGRKTAQYELMYTSPATWPGAMHWRYNHANAPAQWSGNKAAAIQLIAEASAKWTAACGVSFVYDGETTTAPYSTLATGEVDRLNVVGWQALDGGIYGATYWSFDSIGPGRFAIIDSDTVLSPSFVGSTAQLTRTMVHEWGHAIGLGHSNVSDSVMSGPPDTSYANLEDLTADDVHGCRCLYGPPSGQNAGYLCSLPDHIDFGVIDSGQSATPYQVTVANSGSAPLTITTVRTGGAEFAVRSNACVAGLALSPGGSCTFSLAPRPAMSGVRIDEAIIETSEGPYRIPLRASVRDTSPPPVTPPPIVNVIEFYQADLNHYFIGSLAADIAALDSGRFPGWVRTGRTFRAYSSPQPGASPVCRIYIPSPFGESHFFSASPSECTDTLAKFPQLVLESPAVMYVLMPDMSSGTCPQGSAPVYRVWNKRNDSNHRYMTDRALRDAMVAQGYVAEGYGADLIAMCAAP